METHHKIITGFRRWVIHLECNICHSKLFNNSYSLVKAHFMGPTGKGMALCKGSKDGKRLSDAQLAGFTKEQEVVDRLVSK